MSRAKYLKPFLIRNKRLRPTQVCTLINMDDYGFADNGTGLTTAGITTCIAITVRGAYWDEDNRKIPFCGLYHWSGFPPDLKCSPKDAALIVLENLYYECLNHLNLEDDTIIKIYELSLIGGERKQVDSDGELLVSGTEREVDALIQAYHSTDEIETWFLNDNAVFTAANFLTHGEMTIEVSVTPDIISYEVIDEPDNSLSASNQTSPTP